MSDKNKERALHEPPTHQLKAAETTHESVFVKIMRKHSLAAGPWAVRASRLEFPPRALYDGRFEQWLGETYGGGVYRITATAPDTLEQIGKPWLINLDMPAKAAAGNSSMGPFRAPGQSLGVPSFGAQPMVPGQPFGGAQMPGSTGFGPIQPSHMAYDEDPSHQTLVGASQYSDALAMRYGDKESARYEQTLSESRRLQELVSTQREMIAKLEADKDRERLEGQLAALQMQSQQQFQQFQMQMQTQLAMMQGQKKEGPDYAAMLGPIATVLSGIIPAVMQSKTAQAQTAMQADLKRMELQHQLMTKDTPQQRSQLPELLTAAAPLLVPAIQSMMDRNSPELFLAAQNQNTTTAMTMMQMLAEMNANQDDGSPSPMEMGMMILQNLMGAAPDLYNAFRGSRGGGTGPVAPQKLPQPQVVDVQASHVTWWDELIQAKPEYEGAVNTVRNLYQQIPENLGLHTQDWKLLFVNLHAKVSPDQMSQMLASHILSQANMGNLPDMFDALYEDEGALLRAFMMLPIGMQSPEYCRVVAEATLALLEGAGFFGVDEEEDDAPDVEAQPATSLNGATVGGSVVDLPVTAPAPEVPTA